MTYPYFQKNIQPLETSDPDPEPHQYYEVYCGNCHRWGYESQLKKIYSPNPLQQGGVTPELCCPICREAGWLEFDPEHYPNEIMLGLDNLNKAVALAIKRLEALTTSQIAIGIALERECQSKSLQKK